MWIVRLTSWLLAGGMFFAGFGFAGDAVAADDHALVVKGEYLAQAGDCIACHTNPGGALFAGGRALATPFGTIYSSNVTPDPATGIGK
jgi:mono/diheme cytochrome c family protein